MIKEKLESDLKSALKAGEATRVSVLRLVITAVRNKEIEKQKKDTGLSDDEVIAVLQAEVRKRRDAVEQFRKGGREELAKKEESEIGIIQPYLPAEASDEDIDRAVRDAVAQTRALTPADFGKAMKAAMATLKGRASGDRVSDRVKTRLAELSARQEALGA
ncbi:MAG: GatB/YqeY domain-containing protein [Candidatus Niyogibacteria bacterium]|nr:GatB/YqeY domain-containing protein [Candidatus Niyogibacteria bacterium]